MQFAEARKKLMKMKFKKDSLYNEIKNLILKNEILHTPMYSCEIAKKLRNATLKRIKSSIVITYMKPFIKNGIVKTEFVDGKRIWYGSWVKFKERNTPNTFFAFFPKKLLRKLGEKFKIDFNDLNLVWNKSGNCTAFLLRRIIEKSIYFAFAKQGMIEKLNDPSNHKKIVGLEKMINIASREKGKDGTPYISPKTAIHLKRSKFLGDAAAHNFLANIYMEQIRMEINYIITALEELSKKM